MNWKEMTIKQIHEGFKNKTLKISEITNEVINDCENNLKFNFLNQFLKDEILTYSNNLEANFEENNLLYGIPYITKDNIWAENSFTTASSNILKNFISPEDATITKKLRDKKTILVGKSALDELGMGGTGLYSNKGYVVNPLDETRIAGGSSVGSAFAVAKKIVPFSIGTDTGDSIRKPASYVGIVGFKPTYGSISRFGVIPYSPSLDHVGFFTRNIEDMIEVSKNSFEYDKKDFTSTKNETDTKKELKKIRFGYFSAVKQFSEKKLWNKYELLFEKLKDDGHLIQEFNFNKELLDAISYLYMIISFSEAVSTSANLDGINFGKRVDGENYIDVMKKTRTNGFGSIVKKRFLLGNYQLQKENQQLLLSKAKKIRRLIKLEIDKFYLENDILILPPTQNIAPKIVDVLDKKIEDREFGGAHFLKDILIIGNFNGMPSVTIPFVKENDMPIGINLNANLKEDFYLLEVAKYFESKINNLSEKEKTIND